MQNTITHDEMLSKLQSYKFYIFGGFKLNISYSKQDLFVSMCELCYYFSNAGIYDQQLITLLNWIENLCTINE